MTHPDPLTLLWAALAGLGLGIAFFAGLWWSLRRGLASRRPALWLVSSLLLRLALAVAGFYWVGAGDWLRLLACLAGFLAGRGAVAHWSGRALHEQAGTSAKETHATEP